MTRRGSHGSNCNDPVGLRSMSLSGPRRYKRVCICNGILNKAGYKVQVSGYRVDTGTKYTCTSTKLLRKERRRERKQNQGEGGKSYIDFLITQQHKMTNRNRNT